MILPTGLPPSESLRSPTQVSPRRKRMCRMMMSWPSSSTESPAMHTPSPGAVLPAIVRYGTRMRRRSFRRMIPATLKTTMRKPPASTASRKLPKPPSLRFVTTKTFPPRPPKLYMPPPCAPGNAGIFAWDRSLGLAAPGRYGLPLASHSLMVGRALAQASSECRFIAASLVSASSFTSPETRGYWARAVGTATVINARRAAPRIREFVFMNCDRTIEFYDWTIRDGLLLQIFFAFFRVVTGFGEVIVDTAFVFAEHSVLFIRGAAVHRDFARLNQLS